MKTKATNLFRIAGLHLLALLLLPSACSRDDATELSGTSSGGDAAAVEHDMIVLGDKLEDPYSVENVKAALAALYPTKAGRVDVTPTDLYARFLPADDAQYQQLLSLGLELSDHPCDYKILREGDYYHDPQIDQGKITWQYAVVAEDFSFPEGIRYEILDRCFIPDHAGPTRADDGIDWAAVEREAFRLTGNGDLLLPDTRGGAVQPEGRITIVDERVDGGKAFGVAGVRVMTNVFVNFSTTYTDRDGYYKIPKSYSSSPRYRLVFKNSRQFAIGVNLILLPASVSTLGKGDPSGIDVTVRSTSDRKLFCRCVVNNAVYDYIGRCAEGDMDITPPPSDLRIWIFQKLANCSAVMLHHGAVVSSDALGGYLKDYEWLPKLFAPDVTLGVKDHDDYGSIYSSTVHELAHASHYARVGNDYWNHYIEYISQSYFQSAGQTYGDGTGEGAGYCEVGETWAYYMESKLFAERYGGSMLPLGTSWWFFPQIFRGLDDRGFTRAELFAALTSDVHSRDALQKRLLSLYPERESLIRDLFNRYSR